MSPRATVPLIALLTMTVALAGCTSDDAGTDSSTSVDAAGETDLTSIDLGNRGAITGLVVDDNYRPVQLKEDWGSQSPGDFQDIGFVLILETAQRFETNENGEFAVLPLDPGTYTLKVAADNHEAIDQQITVVAGEFAEITIEARRTFSAGGQILSQEQVLFVGCALATTVVRIAALPCGDTSGDSEVYAFSKDFSAIAEDVRGMVTELRVHQQGYVGVSIRTQACDHAAKDTLANGCMFGEFDVNQPSRWGKIVLYPDLQILSGHEKNFDEPANYLQEGEEGYCHPRDGKSADQCIAADHFGRFFAWDPTMQFNTILFADHASKQHSDTVLKPFWPQTCTFPDTATIPWTSGQTTVGARVKAYLCDGSGNGVVMGVKGQFLQTVYLYELPEQGIEDFCALCDDADIPE